MDEQQLDDFAEAVKSISFGDVVVSIIAASLIAAGIILF
jgi:hypothetical protein